MEFDMDQTAFWGWALLIFVLWMFYKWAKHASKKAEQREQEQRKLQAEQEARRQQAAAEEQKRQEQERRWDNYYRQQLAIARQLRRSDKEIEQWARENHQIILANETSTLAAVNIKLENWAPYFLNKPHGQEIIEWWQEPLKEIKYAKAYIAQGGRRRDRLQERLAEEELQAEVLQFRKEFAERMKQGQPSHPQSRRERSHSQSDDGHHPDRGRDYPQRETTRQVVERQEKGGFFRGLLAEIKQAFGLKQ